MVRADKAAAVAELSQAFRDSSAAVLTEYRGLTVAELKELRRSLGDEAQYTVVKNTLTKIAARDSGFELIAPMLEGPSAIAFVTGDPVTVAKGLRDFVRAHPLLVIKGGVLEGRQVGADDIRRLADLQSREEILASFAGAVVAALSRAAATLQAPLAQAARLADALRAKVEAEGPAGGGAAAAPAAEAPAAEAPAEGAPADAAAGPAPDGTAETITTTDDPTESPAAAAADSSDEATAEVGTSDGTTAAATDEPGGTAPAPPTGPAQDAGSEPTTE